MLPLAGEFRMLEGLEESPEESYCIEDITRVDRRDGTVLCIADESYFNFHVKHGGKRLEHYSCKQTIYTGGYPHADEMVGGDLILLCVRPSINSTDWKCFAERHFSLIHLNLFDDWPAAKFSPKHYMRDVEKERQRQRIAEEEFLRNPLTSPHALPYQL